MQHGKLRALGALLLAIFGSAQRRRGAWFMVLLDALTGNRRRYDQRRHTPRR